MKVLNLRCNAQHPFEGWFGSEADFQDQLARGLVACPMCGDTRIEKLLSAPRINLGAAQPPQAKGTANVAAAPSAPVAMDPGMDTAAHARFLRALREVGARAPDRGHGVPAQAQANLGPAAGDERGGQQQPDAQYHPLPGKTSLHDGRFPCGSMAWLISKIWKGPISGRRSSHSGICPARNCASMPAGALRTYNASSKLPSHMTMNRILRARMMPAA